MAHGTKIRQFGSALKKFRDRVTHEVPTGPHTDVKRRKLNPSFRKKITGVGPDIESGKTKERKRKSKVMGMGWKNVVKRMVGQKEGGRIGKQHGGRTNLLEELGRVEGEPSNRNRRAEISRVHGELNRGYKKGGRAGYSIGTIVKGAKKAITSNVFKPKGVFKKKPVDIDKLLKNLGDEIKAQPLPPKLKETMKKLQKAYPHKKAAGGRIGLRHGGSAGAATRGHGAEIK